MDDVGRKLIETHGVTVTDSRHRVTRLRAVRISHTMGAGGGLSPEALAEAQKKLEQMSGPGAKPGLPGLSKPGLPGLGSGGGLPGLGSFNPFRKK